MNFGMVTPFLAGGYRDAGGIATSTRADDRVSARARPQQGCDLPQCDIADAIAVRGTGWDGLSGHLYFPHRVRRHWQFASMTFQFDMITYCPACVFGVDLESS
jgi:hypothetical protein